MMGSARLEIDTLDRCLPNGSEDYACTYADTTEESEDTHVTTAAGPFVCLGACRRSASEHPAGRVAPVPPKTPLAKIGRNKHIPEVPKDKPVEWMGSSLEDLSAFPAPVKRIMGFAIRQAQKGKKHPDARPMQGFGGAAVLEVVEDHNKSTYRAVYTVKFEGVVYVLHAFQKKSKKGSETPKPDMDLIRRRLKDAEQIHGERGKEES
jgi:phage-related protein